MSQPLQVRPAAAAADKNRLNTAQYPRTINHWDIPVAVETMGPINQKRSALLDEVANRIVEISEDPETEHFFINDLGSKLNSIAFPRKCYSRNQPRALTTKIKRLNSIAFGGTFIFEINPDR